MLQNAEALYQHLIIMCVTGISELNHFMLFYVVELGFWESMHLQLITLFVSAFNGPFLISFLFVGLWYIVHVSQTRCTARISFCKL